MQQRRIGLAGIVSLLWLTAAADLSRAQPKLVSPDQGRLRINASVEHQLRVLADGFEPAKAYLSQSALVVNVEPEADLLVEPWGPVASLSGFARIEVRDVCVYNGCGTIGGERIFGGDARASPARNWADGPTLSRIGPYELRELGIPVEHVQDDLELLPIVANPGFAPFFDLGIDPDITTEAFGPVASDSFSWKEIHVAGQDVAVPLGPWPYGVDIEPNGALRHETSTTLPLPLRPATSSLYTPSASLREEEEQFDSFGTNFDEHELAWNHGASQSQTYELKEIHLDLEALDSRLWIRAGKQNIVWGKTELFRTTDQFNPVDLGLASLPSLEESRVALWSLRGIYSFYDVGPLEDVRLELAANLDRFEPIDLGRCGEPYAIWLVCIKSSALWAHGTTGTGLAGEEHPPSAWDDLKGIEVGARLEFRLGRFAFALMDFYGYDDAPTIELFNEYGRNVDVATGRPFDARGRPLTPANALDFASANRQAYDLGCKASLGFGANALLALTGGMGQIPDVSQRCIGDLLNMREPVEINGLPFTVPSVVGALLAGSPVAQATFTGAQSGLGIQDPAQLTQLNHDPSDGRGVAPFFGASLSFVLTVEQEALLGCGDFYGTNCDVDGIDFFNSEASVLLQSFPGLEGNPVATRFEDGRLHILPGARGPGQRDYDVNVDGSPPAGFPNELAALSANLAKTLAVLGIAEGDTECNLSELETCEAIRALVALTGSKRPEVRAGGTGSLGRRVWGWQGGGEAAFVYPKRNVLGVSLDFAEDRTLSTWNVELAWIHGASFASNEAADLNQRADSFNLTLSVDRPTFVRFLNQDRTFFLNSQIFFRHVPGHDSSFDTDGPFTVLGTFTIATGYFHDRLLPAVVFVHDLRSASGGVIGQISYKFSENFSATVGALLFYGEPDDNRLPFHPIAMSDATTDFETRTRYDGLSAVAERDEVFLKLRWTF